MRRTIDNIQYFRGFAALSVVLAHILNQLMQWNSFAERDVISGKFGVDVFFAISGLIMWHTGLRDRKPPGQFAWRRISRIVPLYWITTGVELVLRWIEGNPTTVLAIICSLFFIPTGSNPVLGVGWTLNFEMYFYALIIIALLVNRKIAPWIVLFVLVIAPLTHPLAKNLGPIVGTWTDPSLFLFALGIVIGIAWDRWPQRAAPAFLWIAAAAMVAMLLGDNVRGHHLPLALQIIAGAAIVGMATFTVNISPTGIMKPLHWLGDASYSLYLTHVLTLGFLKQIVVRTGMPVWTWAALALPLSIFVAFLSWKFVERPLSQWLNHLSRRRSTEDLNAPTEVV